MGTCLMCHRKIRNGQKFCDSCKQKRKNRADESYLDSLLNSVGVSVSQPVAEPPVEEQPVDEQLVEEQFVETPIAEEQQVVNVDENSVNPEIDDMLSDILDDMEQAQDIGPEPEPDIKEDDLDGIFDEAEAYATLLNKEEPGQVQEEEPDKAQDEFIDIDWKTDNPDSVEDLDSIENLENIENIAGADTENSFENNAGIEEIVPGSDIDALFDEVDAQVTENFGDISGHEELNNVDESLQGENTEQIAISQAFSDFDPIEEEISKPKKNKKKKKLSWFKRLFGNTNDEVTPEMLEAERIRREEEEELAKALKEEQKRKAEEKRAEIEAEKARKKAEADAERNRKMVLEAEKKAAAKEKERKKQETALAIAEYEMEHGKINKAGATILFVIFAILTIVIIVGTNIYSYNLSIKNAQEDFDVQKYNEAYYEVYGLKIQDEDIELYDRIMTVMFVNTQLNAYEYYMTSNNREKALDSLVKGLQRYDKYLQLAQALDITDDLNYVKGEILEKLNQEFNMSESDARVLMDKEEAIDYSEYLYGLLGSYSEELEKYK